METTAAFTGLICTDCGATFDAAAGRCPDCGGVLDPAYDYDAVDASRDSFGAGGDGLWRYEAVLPFERAGAVTLAEGGTPLVDCPSLADELGVGRVVVKDEGRNPTGTAADREMALALTAAAGAGTTDVALASTGDDGQSAAAYAARAGLTAHAFLPSRAGFARKAMVNVHGGDMRVVEGRLGDAVAAREEATADREGWRAVDPFATPYRHEGAKTLLFEVVADLDWEVPDAVVYPTGHGVGLAGAHKAATELRELGLTDALPGLYAAQAEGCAPVARAFEEGDDATRRWERPDTICGGIEVPDPAGGAWALRALRETGGGAVATSDDDVLESAAAIASRVGVEMSASAAAAASGAWELAQRGAFDADDTVVLVNATAGNKDADVLRSHLMGQGI